MERYFQERVRGGAARRSVVLLGLSVVMLAGGGRGQSPEGRLAGAVEDASGGRIPSARVVAHSEGLGFEREARANARGEFLLDELPPGSYRLSVTAAGFAEARAEVIIVVNSTRDILVTLAPAARRESVEVRGQASSIASRPLDRETAVHEGAVTSQELAFIPLAHRSFANIAYLVPGTEPVEPSDPTKARITAVSFGGSSGLNDQLSVDGADNSDDYIGGFLENISPDAIQEFAVRTAQEDADTGRTTAGSVVITTKRGTNDWHGSGAFYERAASLNARFPIENPAPNPKQPFSRQNYIATLGGPLKKDKVWVFSSFEHVHENASIAYSPASTAQFDALASLAADGLIAGVSSIAVPQSVTTPFRDYFGSLRLDWAQSTKSQWFLRTSEDSYVTHNALVQQATLPSTGLTTHNNYWNTVISNQYAFNSNWLGSFVFDASMLHLTQTRNSNLGFALAFPFSSTSLTVSGFETFGDNQFATPITLFPALRNQEKYQLRYDVAHATGDHSIKFGVNFIHEPVLGGAFAGTAEELIAYRNDPDFYAANPSQFYFGPPSDQCVPAPNPASGISCTFKPASNGSFSQNVQRLALYAEDAWHVSRHVTLNFGLRYQTTFGLFLASGRSQLENPAYLTLKALGISLINGAPHDYRKQLGPRVGIAYSPGESGRTVVRAGFGMFYNDLAQNGWAAAFQGVNTAPGVCVVPTDPGCLAPGAPGALIDPRYKTPYAIHATAGVQHALSSNWTVSADYTHEEGNHAYRGYTYTPGVNIAASAPSLAVFRSDNRSSYNALMLQARGNVAKRFNLVANYTLSHAQTWGCVLGELFDYVNGVCDPLNAFARGDYGASGEDVRHRFVLAGTVQIPCGFELATLTQAESARPFTITTADNSNRISVNGVKTALDEFRGTPYIQADVRLSRPIRFGERWEVRPFAEFFNLLNRNNPGANYVANVGALAMVPRGEAQTGNVTSICANAACTATTPITSLGQLRMPAGALGDFFGPGTTVGIPFAAQLGVRVSF